MLILIHKGGVIVYILWCRKAAFVRIFLYSLIVTGGHMRAAAEKEVEHLICAICHDDLQDDHTVAIRCDQERLLLHTYHTKCIKQWCDTSNSFVCILCKKNMPSDIIAMLNAKPIEEENHQGVNNGYPQQEDINAWQQTVQDLESIGSLFIALAYFSSSS